MFSVECPFDEEIVLSSENPQGFTVSIENDNSGQEPTEVLEGGTGVVIDDGMTIVIEPDQLNPDETARIMEVTLTVAGATNVTITFLDGNSVEYQETVSNYSSNSGSESYQLDFLYLSISRIQ